MQRPVRDLLRDRLAIGTRADRVIATYMLAQIATLPFETAASIAAKVDVSEPTVGRFCRSLGFESFKDLKAHLKKDIGDAPWLVSDRLRDLREKARAGEDPLIRALELELAAVVAVYEIAHGEEFRRVVARLAWSDAVFAAGFQTERGMAQYFVNQLQYLRDRVQLLDLAAGSFAEVLSAPAAGACLVIFEARRYSRMAPMLAQEARAAGLTVTLVTDAYCDWGHDVANEMFVVPTEINLFWESTAQMACLANLMVNGVFHELGSEAERRMNRVAQLYGRFTGHTGTTAAEFRPDYKSPTRPSGPGTLPSA
ncbi:MAG: MurR/RpiR family transcriptional regulator [Paracoccaceae bacterium]